MRVGDVVRLKSGGPDMTVETLRGGGVVECVWFDGAQRQAAHFLAQTLETVARARPDARRAAEGEPETDERAARMVRKPRKGVH